MNPDLFQLIAGVSIAHTIGQESRPQTAFAAYDALSSNEPSQAWQLVKRLLHRSFRFAKSSQTVRRQTSYSAASDHQATPLFE